MKNGPMIDSKRRQRSESVSGSCHAVKPNKYTPAAGYESGMAVTYTVIVIPVAGRAREDTCCDLSNIGIRKTNVSTTLTYALRLWHLETLS